MSWPICPPNASGSSLDRALGERNPEVFIEVLRDCGALAKLLPELDALFGVPQPEAHHPEIDSGLHTLMSLAASGKAERCRGCPVCGVAA